MPSSQPAESMRNQDAQLPENQRLKRWRAVWVVPSAPGRTRIALGGLVRESRDTKGEQRRAVISWTTPEILVSPSTGHATQESAGHIHDLDDGGWGMMERSLCVDQTCLSG